MVQWLGLHASPTGDTGSIPSQGAKITHAVWCSWKNNNNNLKTVKISDSSKIACFRSIHLTLYIDIKTLTATVNFLLQVLRMWTGWQLIYFRILMVTWIMNNCNFILCEISFLKPFPKFFWGQIFKKAFHDQQEGATSGTLDLRSGGNGTHCRILSWDEMYYFFSTAHVVFY